MQDSLDTYGFNELKSFPLRDTSWEDDWQELQDACCYLTPWGKDLLSKNLRGIAESVVLEPHYTCKDHRNLYSNYYSKKFLQSSAYTSRLHFFDKPDIFIPDLLVKPEKYRKQYLGFSVIRPVNDHCLGRSVFDPLKILQNEPTKFFCLRTEFKVHIGGIDFSVKGYPYTSQTSDVTVCAHSALWGVCRYLSERYSLYGELYPFDLVKLTDPNLGRTFPYRGMTYSDYSKILSDFGSFPLVLRIKSHPERKRLIPDRFKDLYSYVESGFPVLASFQGHVVTLIGHTIDYKRPIKADKQGLIDSSSFLRHFVVVDDNFFPYRFLGFRNDPTNYGGKYTEKYSIESIYPAVCPLPEKAFLPAEQARKIAYRYVIALENRIEKTGKRPWVTRLFLTTNTAFKRRKIELSQVSGKLDGLCYFVSNLRLPHFIWVMEIGPLNRYKKGFCTAEIIIDATAGINDIGVIYMRIGNIIFFRRKMSIFAEQPSEFRQFTHNLGEWQNEKIVK